MPDLEFEDRKESGVVQGAILGGIVGSIDWNDKSKNAGQALDHNIDLPQIAIETGKSEKVDNSERIEKSDLKFDYAGKRKNVLVTITLPDGGKVSRVTEELPGRDKGNFVLKGYKLPDGTIVEKNIHRNTDGTISVLDKNVDNRHPKDSHEQRQELRMNEKQFIEWVKANQRH